MFAMQVLVGWFSTLARAVEFREGKHFESVPIQVTRALQIC
jgi:hypothetical protein